MERYDIVIIGTGAGGISAAITATVRNKKILLLGSSKISEKVEKAHEIQNYPGLPAVSGADLAQALLGHLEAMEIGITEERVTAVYAMGSHFSVQTAEHHYEGDSVILATGMSQREAFPGEREFLGRGVSYCATCDAALYKGKTVAVVGYHEEAWAEAKYLAELAGKVYYIPMSKDTLDEPGEIEILRQKPLAVRGDKQVETLETEEGSLTVDGVFILRDSVAPEQLVPGLAMEDGHVQVDADMKTNIQGLFACGDIVGKPYQYIKAAGQGNIAALSAVSFLQKVPKKEER